MNSSEFEFDEDIPADCVPVIVYKYDIPVIVEFNDEHLPARLTVSRDPSGWGGKVFVRPDLCKEMDQVSTELNGGFYHLSHESFMGRVRMAFGFAGGFRFEFATDNLEPFFVDDWSER